MGSVLTTSPPIVQVFNFRDRPNIHLPTYLCPETRQRYVLWSDVQDAIQGIDYLHDPYLGDVLFMIDNNGELYGCCEYVSILDPSVCSRPRFCDHYSNTSTIYSYRYLPLRIHLDPNTLYIVVGHDSDNHQKQDDNSNLIPKKSSTYLSDRGALCTRLYKRLERELLQSRHHFQEMAANIRYYHPTLVQYGTVHGRILGSLQTCDRQLLEWEYLNNCHCLFHPDNKWEHSASSLFVVLPSNLPSWDDNDSSTHQFRIYFLCSPSSQVEAQKSMRQHVHFSNHPGFKINYPKEFLRIYGDQALRVLIMVKRGYTDDKIEVPALDTFKILWGCDTNVTGSQLSKDNIGHHVHKAISYLLELSPPKLLNVKMDRHQSAAIKPYLDVPDGDRVEGNLHRWIGAKEQTVFWMCQAHTHHRIDKSILEDLKDFVHLRGGHIDMHQAILRVELGSAAEADQLLTFLKGAKHVFDISIKLNWKPTRSSVEKLYRGIVELDYVALQIDGLTPDVHPGKPISQLDHLFLERSFDRIRFSTLLNYPRPQEQTTNIANCSLQTKMILALSSHDWVGLRNGLEQFREAILSYRISRRLQKANMYEKPSRKLLSTMATLGFTDVTEVTIYTAETRTESPWNATFDLLEGVMVAAYSSNLEGPWTSYVSGSLLRLTQDIKDADLDQKLYRVVQNNARLQELNISTWGREVLGQIDPVVRLWNNSSRPFILRLFDRTLDERGRVVVQVVFGKSASISCKNSQIKKQGAEQLTLCTQGHAQGVAMNRECLQSVQWEYDHIFFHFSDFYASFLDMATEHHASVLISLTLDVSALSELGIVCIQRILARSNLEYFCILCTSFEPKVSHHISQSLMSVPWRTLRQLVLTGENIDGWLQQWPSVFSPRLLSLQIQGSTPSLTKLSHASVLAIHRMIFESPLEELHVGNVAFQDEADRSLIGEIMDDTTTRIKRLTRVKL